MYTTIITTIPTWEEEELNWEMLQVKKQYYQFLEKENYEKCAELLKNYPYLKNTSE